MFSSCGKADSRMIGQPIVCASVCGFLFSYFFYYCPHLCSMFLIIFTTQLFILFQWQWNLVVPWPILSPYFYIFILYIIELIIVLNIAILKSINEWINEWINQSIKNQSTYVDTVSRFLCHFDQESQLLEFLIMTQYIYTTLYLEQFENGLL